jgi:hypothetical protein
MPDESPTATPPPTTAEASPAKPDRPEGTLRAPGAGRTTQAKNPMAFVLLIGALCIAGWFIVNWMSESSRIQDCVMSGRKNCVQMDPALGR